MDYEEKEGLLATGAHQYEPNNRDTAESQSPRRLFLKIYLIVSHFVFILVITYLIFQNRVRNGQDVPDMYSPAQSAVRRIIKHDYYVNRTMTSKYMGVPSQENEDAWRNLVDPTYLTLTEDELLKANINVEDNIVLEEGGYLGVLAAYHQLHCIRRIRHFLYRETFWPWYNSTDYTDYLHGHIDHCLEVLRLVVMCHGDVNLYSYTWHKDYPNATKNIVSRIKPERKCADWESIEGWAKSRSDTWSPRMIDPNGEIIVANEDG